MRGFDLSVRAALYTVKHDGSGLDRLLKAPTHVRLYDGAWAPNGRAIVYEQSGASGGVVRTIRGERILTIATRGGQADLVERWPDRVRDAYAGMHRASRSVGHRSLRGLSGRARLVSDLVARRPSAEGAVHPRGEGSSEVWTVRPDGAVLTRRAGTGASSQVFSPDGRLLAWSVVRFRGDPRLGFTDLLMERADGSARRTLVRGGQAEAPDWQPLPR